MIAFPLSLHRALPHRWAGYALDIAMLLCAGTAVVEAAVHESLELFQESAGVPTLDPHDAPVKIGVQITWSSNDVLYTHGWATI